MSDDTDYNIERVIENGLEILDIAGPRPALEMSAKFAHTLFVQYLNDNGYPGASQALDDLWTPRADQWYRDGEFGVRYLNGEERRNQIFGNDSRQD